MPPAGTILLNNFNLLVLGRVAHGFAFLGLGITGVSICRKLSAARDSTA